MSDKVKDFKETSTNDLRAFFDNFIKQGVVIKEKEVLPGFKVKLKTLSTGELMQAESIIYATNKIPADVVVKVRAASILSQAIISVNGIEIDQGNENKEENNVRRSFLYQKLLDMSAYAIQQAYELYLEAVKEQNDYYENKDKETETQIENF